MSEENKTPQEWTDIVKDTKTLFGSLKRGVQKLIEVAKTEIAKRNAQKSSETSSVESKPSSPPASPTIQSESSVQPAAQAPEKPKKAEEKTTAGSQDAAAEPKADASDSETKK